MSSLKSIIILIMCDLKKNAKNLISMFKKKPDHKQKDFFFYSFSY